MKYDKIGIFDSGFGGLTLFKCIQKALPQFDYEYLGDNARTPYGNRSFDTVLRFTTEGVEFLIDRGCRLVIIACNTASARALRSIQQTWLLKRQQTDPGLRVLGVIRPTVEQMARLSASHSMAVWATPGTVKSDSFVLEAQKYAPGTELIQTPCPLLVPLIEAGELSGPGVEHYISKYWQETLAQHQRSPSRKIDSLLLACTHYPLLLPAIRKVVPSDVKIATQGEIVSASLKDYLGRHSEMAAQLSQNGSTTYFTTDQCEYFDQLAQIFMGHTVTSQKADLASP
ncbi:MAG: glutamate racemase [Bdellovibrionales bacterium GWB1_55_8]|nr:MAG: glutamate racemase [Bdellovibrionales bacterium GWB1_55_8]